MKIGELAKTCGVSKDTIRYYVEKGLLIPFKKGAQMDFTDREYEDMQFIQKMKQMQFSIRDMQVILTLRRMSNFIEPDTIKAYEDILNQKKQELSEEITLLQKAYDTVDQELVKYASLKNAKAKAMGVPLMALSYLYCPHCGRQLMVQNAQISNNCVDEGELICSCGYHAQITGGIIDTGNRYTGKYDRPDLKRGLYRDVGEEFVTGFQKSSDLVYNRLSELNTQGKIVMETNINGYFFLYNCIQNVEKDCLYIITDRYPEMLRMYKQLIETLKLDLNILFLADDSDHFPIKDGCVDVLLDFYGSNEQVIYKQRSFIQEYGRYLKESAVVLGALFGFEGNSVSVHQVPKYYPECSAIALDVRKMLHTYEEAGYGIQAAEVAVSLQTYHKYSFACHQDGEKLLQYYYEASKK